MLFCTHLVLCLALWKAYWICANDNTHGSFLLMNEEAYLHFSLFSLCGLHIYHLFFPTFLPPFLFTLYMICQLIYFSIYTSNSLYIIQSIYPPIRPTLHCWLASLSVCLSVSAPTSKQITTMRDCERHMTLKQHKLFWRLSDCQAVPLVLLKRKRALWVRSLVIIVPRGPRVGRKGREKVR